MAFALVDASGAVQLKKKGPLSFVLSWILGLLFALSGPALMVSGFLIPETEADAGRWMTVAIGAVVACIGIPFTLAMWRGEFLERRYAAQLRAYGVRAEGEITATRPSSLGDESATALTLRVTGPGLAPYEVEYKTLDSGDYLIGARLDLLVDPNDPEIFAVPDDTPR
ncbi:hypothetical protein [Kribbella deserti]|uniref:DUF3592 domain-containing protein n=1 Tax=Kribbella deserti TaxID=1926257 RepID=A0ABV6QJ97_9ACTN